MELAVIKSERQYKRTLRWVEQQFDNKVRLNTPEGRKLEVTLVLIKKYEDEHYPIPAVDPIEAIREKMEEIGLRNKDLVGIVGSKGYVSLILNGRKPLTLEIARIFHRLLKIPAEVFLK
ncbi:MAG: transcriptional regulator [Candidatus Kapabacteria bacterium]|nr:transcriptional regulator [Candidatus Kapabacteria bacterium]